MADHLLKSRSTPASGIVIALAAVAIGGASALAGIASSTGSTASTSILLLGIGATVFALFSRAIRPSPPLALGVALILAGFAFQRKSGFQIEEIIFALYYLPFLISWYILRLFVYRESLIWNNRDFAFAFWLMWIHVHVFVGIVNGSELSSIQSDWLSYGMFSFYFPAREVVTRHPNGAKILTGCLLAMALIALTRNLIITQQTVESASAAWEIARLRTTANEMTMTAGALICIAFASRLRRPISLTLSTIGFASLCVGVIITQWRAYYVSLAIGIIIIGILGSKSERSRIAILVLLSSFLGSLILYVIMGDTIMLLVLGLIDRFLSIGTATHADLSLVNRFWETRSALQHIAQNPIIGHGLGTNFGFFDLIIQRTWIKSYAHNGYISLWFKFGIMGLVCFVWMWISTIYTGISTLRQRQSMPLADYVGFAAALALLIALIPSFGVSAPFGTADTSLCMTLLFALVGGMSDRARWKEQDMNPA